MQARAIARPKQGATHQKAQEKTIMPALASFEKTGYAWLQTDHCSSRALKASRLKEKSLQLPYKEIRASTAATRCMASYCLPESKPFLETLH